MADEVRLLSELAKEYVKKNPPDFKSKSLWKTLAELFAEDQSDVFVKIPEFDSFSDGLLEKDGFYAFCQIRDVKLFVREIQNVFQILIRENEQLWETNEWGEGADFKSRLLAEFYFMVTKDDFLIDDREAEVIYALVNLLKPSKKELVHSKEILYWSLVENAIEDGVITESEDCSLIQIGDALEFSIDEIDSLHKMAIEGRLDDLISKFNHELREIVALSKSLGLSAHYILGCAKEKLEFKKLPVFKDLNY